MTKSLLIAAPVFGGQVQRPRQDAHLKQAKQLEHELIILKDGRARGIKLAD